MGSLKAALKAFFPNNNGDTNFSSSCLVPYFDSSQNPKGCVTPSKLASVLGEFNEKIISVAGISSVSFPIHSCAMLIWCIRGVSFNVGVATIENNNIRLIREGYGTLTRGSGNDAQATITFPSAPGTGCKLHYTAIEFTN